MTTDSYGRLLVTAQFALIGYFALFHPFGLPIGKTAILLVAHGIGFGLWSLVVMYRYGKFRITPTPAEGASLVEAGLYRRIRHPMYLAILLVTLGLVVDFPTLPHFLAFGMLAAILLVKMHHEERLLVVALPGYAEYMRRTKRLIPFLY
jgi:protein-S-isoprenylcysteine O-methyltransferase Ste14